MQGMPKRLPEVAAHKHAGSGDEHEYTDDEEPEVCAPGECSHDTESEGCDREQADELAALASRSQASQAAQGNSHTACEQSRQPPAAVATDAAQAATEQAPATVWAQRFAKLRQLIQKSSPPSGASAAASTHNASAPLKRKQQHEAGQSVRKAARAGGFAHMRDAAQRKRTAADVRDAAGGDAEAMEFVMQQLAEEHHHPAAVKFRPASVWNQQFPQHAFDDAPERWTVQSTLSDGDEQLLQKMQQACDRLSDGALDLCLAKVSYFLKAGHHPMAKT